MAAFQLTTDTMQVLMFVRRFFPLPAIENMLGIGLIRDGELIAGVIYENYNGESVWMHVAAIPGKRWLTKRYLKVCMGQAFDAMGCKRIFGWVPADNEQARRFDEHIGFKQVATIPRAGKGGTDVLIYEMKREDCRYVDPE